MVWPSHWEGGVRLRASPSMLAEVNGSGVELMEREISAEP